MGMSINKSKLKSQKGGHVSINSYFCNRPACWYTLISQFCLNLFKSNTPYLDFFLKMVDIASYKKGDMGFMQENSIV